MIASSGRHVASPPGFGWRLRRRILRLFGIRLASVDPERRQPTSKRRLAAVVLVAAVAAAGVAAAWVFLIGTTGTISTENVGVELISAQTVT